MPQPRQGARLPCARRPAATTVEIHEVHALLAVEQYVVGIEIGVVDAGVVEIADAGADRAPRGHGQARAEQRRQRPRSRDRDRQQVRAVAKAGASIARRDRSRRRQPEVLEQREEPELAKAAGRLRAGPQVAVGEEARDQAATPVVAQYPLATAAAGRGDEPCAAAADRRTARAPGARQFYWVEVRVARMVDPRRVV